MVSLADCVGALPILRVEGACILLVLHTELLLAVGKGPFGASPVLIDEQFEVERGLLADIALEILVHLHTRTKVISERGVL